jgi:hypothetical protein
LIVLDSSGWIEFFADGPHASKFAARLPHPADAGFEGLAGVTVFRKPADP